MTLSALDRRNRAGLALLACLGLATAWVLAPVGVAAAPEQSQLVLVLAGPAPVYLPAYLLADETARAEGLTVRLTNIGGGAQTAAALASGSAHVALTSLNVAVTMISAGVAVRVFYGVSQQADFEWFAGPGIGSWDALRGKTIAISGHGSLTDALTRHALRRHGLVAGQDVNMMQMGDTATRFAALRAGRVDATILLPPFTWNAEALGFRRLGTQARDIAETWPRAVLVAHESFLAGSPKTVHALLRAHVQAIRLARTNRAAAAEALVRHLKLDRPQAERAYEEAIPAFDERGRLPSAVMPLFWEIAVGMGDATEPWPESRFLNRRYVDTFEEWSRDLSPPGVPARPIP